MDYWDKSGLVNIWGKSAPRGSCERSPECSPGRAGQLLGAAQALIPPTYPLLRVTVPYDLPRRVAAARADGDPAAFDRGLAEGQGWTIDAAVAAGLASVPGPTGSHE